jgi:GT2 family glycosyltransferase/exopolysaccharide biosynthesis predicted pyruvyltransferase EpsI
MTPDEHSAAVAASRAALLDEIGDGHDLVFVRGLGSVGDELIWAGTRNLLEEHVYREINLEQLSSSSGDTALLTGSGAWCRSYHEWMPRALAIAELRFDRVIVLPSSFEVGEDAVREALARTEATVFAREPASFEAIAGLCRARVAHDCAFFFDFSGYRGDGTGTLDAFRTDREATEGELMVRGNDDISLTSESLEAWLATIARHAVVRTDRAHVMIAAALMGKEVEFAPSNYHKLQSIADGSLSAFPVRRIAPPRSPEPKRQNGRLSVPAYDRLRRAAPPPPAPSAEGPPRVTAVILSRNRPAHVAAAVRSVTAAKVPVAVLVIDNNSDHATRRTLAALAAEDARVKLRLADRNLGCAGGRRLATDLIDTEFVLFLDDDAELLPGALENLLADLDAHPGAAGVTGLVVAGDGSVLHYGGSMAISEELASFTLVGGDVVFEDPALPPSGPSGWVPGTAVLLRVEALQEFPIDAGMAAYYEDNDWCYRVEGAHPGSFRRCREALVLHHLAGHGRGAPPFIETSEKVEKVLTHAHFFHTHGRLLDVDLLGLVPELALADGRVDVDVARLLLELTAARGTDWATMAWLNGDLDPLLGRARLRNELEEVKADARAREAALEAAQVALEPVMTTLEALRQRAETLARIEAGGWWRLRGRLLPVMRLAGALRRLASSRR